MRLTPPFLLGIALCATSAHAAQLLPVKINGVDETLEAYIRSAVDMPGSNDSKNAITVSEGRLGYYVSNLNTLVEDSLEPLGYYHSQSHSAMTRNGESVQITLTIELGEPIKVRSKRVGVTGDAGKDRFIGFWLEAFEPKPEQVFHHGVYEDNKAQIEQALLDRGYFDQRLTTHTVQITRAEHSADIDLSWDSGIRYRYGEVEFTGHTFKPDLFDKLVNFKQGQVYSQPQINRLQESLSKLDYFNSIEIVPDLTDKQNGEVPITVSLVQGKRSTQHASLRYGSKTGLGAEYGVERRWINSSGHKLDFNVAWAQYEQSFTALYRIPAFEWLDGWYGFGIVTRNEEYATSNSRYIELTGNRSGEFRNWDLLASVNVRRERFDEFIPDINQNVPFNLYTSVLYPEFNAVWRKSDDPYYPTSGIAWYYQARTGYEFEKSNAPFAQVTVKNKRIIGLKNDNRLLLRAEAGAIWTNNYGFFPPSLRFYAGGDQSVRGYGYKEIGEYIGKLNYGGRYLLVGSVEYEHRLNKEWALASFVDVGDAFERKPSANFGAGLGARWRSPIGPVRIDVAYGFNGPTPGIGLHFAIGSDL